MFDDAQDRATYEAFIHAVYKKYNLIHDTKLAATGAPLVESCRVHPVVVEDTLDIESRTTCSM